MRADVNEVYKIINQYDRVNVDRFFTIMANVTTRENNRKFYKRHSRLNIRANVFSNRVVNIWNSLPNEAVLAHSVNAFKSRLNKHWHGRERKFSPACHIQGEPQQIQRRCRNGPSELGLTA